MRNCKAASIVLNYIMPKLTKPYPITLEKNADPETYNCGGFLCAHDGICEYPDKKETKTVQRYYYEIVFAIVHVVVTVCTREQIKSTLLPPLELCGREWAVCLDRRQVWNLNKPPWLASMLALLNPILQTIITTLISAVHTGASMYQAMSLALACYKQLWECIPINLSLVATLLTEIVPADVHPLGDSVLFQFLILQLYEELYHTLQKIRKGISTHDGSQQGQSTSNLNSIASFDGTRSDEQSIANALLEGLCTIDEDNKHTEEIQELMEYAKEKENEYVTFGDEYLQEQSAFMSEIMASDVLLSFEGKYSVKVCYQTVKIADNTRD